MRIIIREKADADLDGIYSWIEKYTPGAAGGADRRVVGGVVGAARREATVLLVGRGSGESPVAI